MSQYSFSYNYDSLNDAFNVANRKGMIQNKYLSAEYLNAAREYRELRKELNKILRKKKSERTDEELSQANHLKQMMKDNAQKQKNLLQEHLSKVSSKILSSNFRFTLTPCTFKDPQKPIYTIGDTAEEFFAMQVLCRNVKTLFKISMSSRLEILSQLKMLLKEDKNRYYIIRTDVCHCFESIPHNKLFEYIEDNNLLDVKSKSLLRGLIRKEFEDKNLRKLVQTPQTGIPRGCAISSLLAELYLSKIDEKIRYTLPGVVYMARYVDDMVIIIHPDIREKYHKSINWYICELTKIFSQMELLIHTSLDNSGKCYTYDSDEKKSFDFNLLGYRIRNNNGKLTFSLSQNKLNRIKAKIDKSFNAFNNIIDTAGFDVAANYLFDALHILTCNINLYGAKRSVKVGIFYSNQLLDNVKNLEELDKYLQYKCQQISLIGKASVDPVKQAQIETTLKKQLKQVSFVKGFAMPHKRYKIKKNRLQLIKKTWV